MSFQRSSFIRKSSVLVVVIFILGTVALAWQAQKFEIDASAETLLMKTNKHYIVAMQSNERYQPQEFILIAHKPKEKNVFAKSVLTRLQRISEELKKIERVKNVRSIADVPIFVGASDISSDTQPESLTWESKKYSSEFMRKSLKRHPLYEGLLVNRKQTTLSMQVVFESHSEEVKLRGQIVDIKSGLLTRELTEDEKVRLSVLENRKRALDKELNKIRSQEIVKIRSILEKFSEKGEFYLGGASLLRHQLIEIIENDLIVFGSIITAIICLVLWFLFRKVRWVLIPIICCGVSVVFTLGLLATLGLKATVISANVIALQIILSLATMIHLIEAYQEHLERKEYKNQLDLVVNTVKSKVRPCFYAGVTTSIGFAALIFSGVQPVISFGWMMVIAMCVTLFVGLLLFPALLVTFCCLQENVQKHGFIERAMAWSAKLVVLRPKLLVILSLFVTGLGLIGCFKLSAENSFINYFAKTTDVYRELSFIDKEFGGSTPLDILYTIPKSEKKADLIVSAKTVQKIEDIQSMLSEIEGMGSLTSIADFTRIAQAVSGKPLTEYELTAFYRLLDKNLRDDLFGTYFSKENGQVRISARIEDSTKDLNRAHLMKSIHQGMEKLGIGKDDYTLTNLFVLYQDILARLVNSQITTLIIVYAAMIIVLVLIFGNIKVAFISIIPNLVTTATIMGMMGLLKIPLDLMTMTIAAVAMGISVDDTIHYVHRFLQEKTSSEAVKRTHMSVGYALIYTTSVITLGFGAFVFSDFVPSVLFGFLTAAAMIVALVTDITILPVLLTKYVKRV